MATGFDWSSCGVGNCGSQNPVGQTFDSYTFNGVTSLTNCTVSNNTSVNGMLTLNGSTLNSLDLQGSGTFNGATINGIAKIKGMINAGKCFFHSQLFMNTSNSSLTDTITKDIVIEDSSDRKDQKIYLRGNTYVQGSITFNRPGGTVYKTASARIDGLVSGANVVDE